VIAFGWTRSVESSTRYSRKWLAVAITGILVMTVLLGVVAIIPAISTAGTTTLAPTQTTPTFHNYIGYLGNDTVYPTTWQGKELLPAESSSVASVQVPGSYDNGYNSTWPVNYATINTMSSGGVSYYETSGSPEFQLVLSFWVGATGVSQVYTTGCSTQNFSCSSNVENEYKAWVPSQGTTTALSSNLPSGFSASITSQTLGMNTTSLDTSSTTNPNFAQEKAAIDLGLNIVGLVFPAVGDLLTANSIGSDVGTLVGNQAQYSSNQFTDDYGPITPGETGVVWAATQNGTVLNPGYTCPPSSGPLVSWTYPAANPCAPPVNNWAKAVNGQNTFGQGMTVLMSNTNTFTSESNAAQYFGSIPSGASITFGAQNNVEVQNANSASATMYSTISEPTVPGARASISYSFAPALSLSGTVINSASGPVQPVDDATVTIQQVCSGSSGTTDFTETTGESGQWHFFVNPSCSFSVSATDVGPYGTVGSPTQSQTSCAGVAEAGGECVFPQLALNNYQVSITIANGYVYGLTWSAELANTVGEQSSSTSTSSTIPFYAPAGTYTYYITPYAGYSANPWTNQVTISGSTEISTTFTTYTVTFQETGLPSGLSWCATLDGVKGCSDSPSSVVFSTEANGEYYFVITAPNGYSASPHASDMNVTGSNVVISITFVPATYTVKFVESGLPSGDLWNVSFAGTYKTSTSTSISFLAANGTYSFTIYGPSTISGDTEWVWEASPPNGQITVSGSGVTEDLVFTEHIFHI